MSFQAQPQVFIAVPAYGGTNSSQTTSTLLGLTRLLVTNGMAGGFGTLSFPDIEEIRNIFLTIWYDKIITSYLLMVDADMGFDPNLIMEMVSIDKPLVGALCPKRKLPIEFAGRAKMGPCQVINGFMEVDGVGGAIMLIRRDCVDAIMNKYPELSDEITIKNHAAKDLFEEHKLTRLIRGFDKLAVHGETFSEDLSFCIRHREAWPGGGQVWGNITHKVTHVGPHEFSGCYFDFDQGSDTDGAAEGPGCG